MRDIESKFQELAMDPRRGDVSPEAGAPILDEVRRRCVSDCDLYRLIGNDASTAVCKVLQGDIGDGIRFLEEAISKQEKKISIPGGLRLRALTKSALENRGLDPSGQHVGSAHKAPGLLFKVKKRRALAFEHLTGARIFSQFGPSSVLTRVETALEELQK